jgi:hypothetical protein
MRDRTRSDGEFRIAFENLHLEFWRFSIFPKAGSKFHAIAESTSIRMVTAFEGARNADEFSLEESARRVNNRVAVASHIDKRKMWRQMGIG